MAKHTYAFILLMWISYAYPQSNLVSVSPASTGDSSLVKVSKEKTETKPEAKTETKPEEVPMGSAVYKPVIGFGIGTLAFSGAINSRSFIQNPALGRIGYDITVSQKINRFLNFNFYGLIGKLSVAQDQNAPVRNANFESKIVVGGVNLQYNFDQFLPKKRNIEPFILSGIESFSFNSKTDLVDKNGNRYYYWSDGSIKNLPQNDPNAANAVTLVRDYQYLTDLRQLDQYGFGLYPLTSFAIPLGIGAVFHLSERVDLKIHTTMHFTFTDYIDGLGGQKDKFLMTGFSLHWDLLGPKRIPDTLGPHWFDSVDFLALETGDTDGDGVRDTADLCPGTPAGVTVDAHGCPLDSDGDGVPDYLDKEPNSKPNATVDMAGVTLSDSLIKQRYLLENDTTNEFAEVITKFHGPYDLAGTGQLIENPAKAGKQDTGKFIPKEYVVLLGTFKSGLPNNTMSKFLSIRDIETTALPDSAIAYTVGHYTSFEDALSRKRTSTKEGIMDAKVVYKKNGQFVEATSDVIAESSGKKPDIGKNLTERTEKEDSLLVANTKGVVFRIQLGAYKRRISKTIFGAIADLIEIRTEDGMNKYMTGAFSSFKDAAKSKIELNFKGYEGAFITAYKDGKRVPLSTVGATPAKNKKDLKEDVNEPEKPRTAISKSAVVFKVQIGVFKNQAPPEKTAKYRTLKETVDEENTSTGLTRFTVGNTNSYNEAVNLKNKMVELGLDDSFVIAFFNGQYITIQEALEISK